MIIETLDIANIKCSGCANTIRSKISDIQGVAKVDVREDEGQIDLTYSDISVKKAVLDKLRNLGYPEATEDNGLLLKAKSYASCMVGRLKD